MECPLQARFKYLDRLPQQKGSRAVFGSVVHHALDQFNRTGDAAKAIETFKDCWANPDKLGLTIDHWNRYSNFANLKKKGLESLEAYFERMALERRTVLGSEHRFLVGFGAHQLEGVVDVLTMRQSAKGKNLLLTEDYKTSASVPTKAELSLNLQGTVYIYASMQPEFFFGNPEDPEKYPPLENAEWWWNTLQDTPRRFLWVAMWKGGTEVDGGERCIEDFERLYRVCDGIASAIDAGVFIPRIGEATCGQCDYVAECGLHIPTEEEMAEDAGAWV